MTDDPITALARRLTVSEARAAGLRRRVDRLQAEADHWRDEVLILEAVRESANNAIVAARRRAESLEGLNSGLQDDLERTEEYLGRALNRLRPYVVGLSFREERPSPESRAHWRDYVRELLGDDYEAPDDLRETLGRVLARLRAHVGRDLDLTPDEWQDYVRELLEGGETSDRQAGAASEPTPEPEAGAASPGREDPAGGCSACGAALGQRCRAGQVGVACPYGQDASEGPPA